MRAHAPPAQAPATASAIARSTSTSRSCAAGCPAAAAYTTYSRFPAGPGTQESHTPRTAAPARGDEGAEFPQHPPAHLGIAHDAAAHLAAPGLELRLHQHERPPARLGARERGRQHQPQRDERDVGRDQRRRDTAAPRARGGARSRRRSPSPARSAREALVQLVSADVDRDHARRAVLEQAVGEPAGGRAHVQAALPGHVDRERPQRRLELLAAARDVARRRRPARPAPSAGTGEPAFVTTAPSTSTRPAMISACARLRDSAMPRSAMSTSRRVEPLTRPPRRRSGTAAARPGAGRGARRSARARSFPAITATSRSCTPRQVELGVDGVHERRADAAAAARPAPPRATRARPCGCPPARCRRRPGGCGRTRSRPARLAVDAGDERERVAARRASRRYQSRRRCHERSSSASTGRSATARWWRCRRAPERLELGEPAGVERS